MFSRRILLSILGLGLTIGSAHATTTYSSAAAFASSSLGGRSYSHNHHIHQRHVLSVVPRSLTQT